MTMRPVKSSLTPFWDCHSHLSFLEDQVVENIVEENLQHHWVFGGYEPSEWQVQEVINKKFPKQTKTCFGLHPWFVRSEKFNPHKCIEDFKVWSNQADFVGEIGLDFFKLDGELKKDLQEEIFNKQLEINPGKPLVLHVVQAHGRVLEILDNYTVRGFVHSFSGSLEVAQRYYAKGLLLSFGPNILKENFKNAKLALENLPLEAILVESDTPSNHSDTTSPIETLSSVYEFICELKGVNLESLQQQVSKNLAILLK